MRVTNPKFLEILLCTDCRQNNLNRQNGKLVCANCRADFSLEDGKIILLDKELAQQHKRYQKEVQSPVNKLKTLIKRWPWFFQFLTYAIGSISYFWGSPVKAAKKYIGDGHLKEKIVINIGSGTKRLHPEIINLDIFPFKEVDFVTDATKLPMKDNSVDMIISESTLEHIPDAELAIKEIRRVVKPGGYVYISVPFLLPFHASPNDYLRLTHEGIKHKFRNFEPMRTGMNGGPGSALVGLLMHLIALPFSIISDSLYNLVTYIVLIPLSPLRILDLLYYLFPRSIDAAAMTYFIGKKKE